MKSINFLKSCLAKTNSRYYFSLFFICLIALIITFSNLGITKEFIGDDAGVGYHFSNERWNMTINMWDSNTFPGRSDVIATIALFHNGSINLLNRLGLTSILIDRIYYFLFYFISGAGMYFLSFYLGKTLFITSKNKIWLASMMAAVFFMLNNFTMILLSFPPTNYAYSYMFLPWIFFLYLKDFHLSNNLLKKIIFAILFLILLGGNPPNTISIVFFLLLYELFFRSNNRIVHNLKKFGHTLILIILLTSYISLPVWGNQANPYGNVLRSDNRVSISFSSTTTSFLNLFRLRGHHSQDTFVFNKFLLDDSVIAVNYFLLMIVLLVFIFRKKISKIEIYLLLTYVLFLFLIKAEHAPFVWISRWFYDNIPFFEMYRASYFKFGYFCVFSFSILLAVSLLKIDEKILKWHLPAIIKNFIIISPLLMIFFGAQPFFWGKVVRDMHKTIIPVEYHTAKTYFEDDKTNFSILSLPQRPFGLTLDWGNGNYYGGGHPDTFLLGKPVWSNGWFLPANQTGIDLSFYKNILDKTNIKYILLHKDIPENYSFEVNVKGNLGGQTNFNKFNDQITIDKDFELIEDNYFFKVFKIKQKEYKPHFYAPQNIIASNQTVKSLLSGVFNSDNKIRSVIYFKNQNKDIPLKILNKSNLNIGFAINISEKSSIFNLEDEKIKDKNYNLKKYLDQSATVNVRYSSNEQMVILSLVNEQLSFNSQKTGYGVAIFEARVKKGDVVKVGKNVLTLTENTNNKILFSENIEIYNIKEKALNASFEEALWQDKPGDCTNGMKGEPDLSMQLSDDSTEGKNSLELGSKNHYACTNKNFPTVLSQNKIYRYSFDYKNVKGNKIDFALFLNGKGYTFSEKIEIKNNEWNHYETFIEPEEDIKSVILYFYSPSDGSKEVVNRFDNVQMEELELVNTYNIDTNSVTVQKDIKLTEGENKIEYIGNQEEINLIKNVSFEEALWQDKPGDCTNGMKGEPDLSMQLSDDSTEGKNSLELGSKNHYACTNKNFPTVLSQNKIYRYSFDYKNVKGNKIDFALFLNGKGYTFSEKIEIKNNEWNHYETFIEPEEDIKSVILYFYSPSDGSKEVVNRFDNVQLVEWMPKDIFNYYLYSPAKEKIETPVIEFKKINPTKYRIRIHGAKGDFPLVFSESFHSGWKAYLAKPDSYKVESYKVIKSEDLDNYKILDGNADDQASGEELADYISKGWVTDLGNGKQKTITHKKWEDGKEKLDYVEKYKIDFVSKNFQDTIQNDNLPAGNFWETWLPASYKVESGKLSSLMQLNKNVIELPEENHLTANGYANSWWINLDDVCKNNNACIKNADGSYDFEMVVEFWPQRLFYVGLAISGLTLFGCLAYLWWTSRKRINEFIKSSSHQVIKLSSLSSL